MSSPVRVLFVSHDGFRSGATLFLHRMLSWMQAHTNLSFSVAVRGDGDMVEVFEQLCETHVLATSGTPGLRSRLRNWWPARDKSRRRPQRSLQSLLDSGAFDLLYLNTITLGDQLARLGRIDLPVITHVHELPSSIQRYARGEEQRVLRQSDHIICVSEVVREHLVQDMGCPAEKAALTYGFVPLDVTPQGTASERRDRLLAPLGIPSDALLLGLCGHGDIRKGADLVVPLARMLPTHINGRELHLVWVGVQAPEYPRLVADLDARLAGVASRVHFTGATRTPVDWISLFDIHLMLSREDPFPQVVMEAAVQGVPTVAFREAGGAAEFIQTDAGACTPFLDLPAMASTLVELLSDDARRARLGSVARERVHASHAPEIVLPVIVQAIQRVAGAGRNR